MKDGPRSDAPTARVVNVTAATVTVLCPYCGGRHAHLNTGRGIHHRAPGCGLYRSEADRMKGYTFTIHPGKVTRARDKTAGPRNNPPEPTGSGTR